MLGSKTVGMALLYLGPVGISLSIGIQAIKLFNFLRIKIGGKPQPLYADTDFGKTMEALDQIKDKIVKLDEKIQKLFQEQKLEGELNTAKMVLFKSVEVLLYG